MEDKGFFSNFFVKVSGDEVCFTSMEGGGGSPDKIKSQHTRTKEEREKASCLVTLLRTLIALD